MQTEKLSSTTDSSLYQIFSPSARDTLGWEPYGSDGRQNVEIKRLYNACVNGSGPAAALLKYAPGARVPTHLHAGYELILVIEGELINDAGRHGPGTLEICPPGSTHALASESGCTFLVVWEQPVVKLT
jgi:anti-sigma factor ChrR (cupin superfamily)